MRKTIQTLAGLLVILIGVAMAPVSGHAQQTSKSKAVASSDLRINLNTGSAAELTQLPGVGEKVAARVVTYRKENGPFKKIEEIMNVKGIGEKTFTRLQPHLFVDPEPQAKKK